MKWINVKDRLPEFNVRVLITSIHDPEWIAFGALEEPNLYWWDNNLNSYEKDYITHWMTLPEPPKDQ